MEQRRRTDEKTAGSPMPAKLSLSPVLALAVIATTACGPDGGSSMRQPSPPANHTITTTAAAPDWFLASPALPLRPTPCGFTIR